MPFSSATVVVDQGATRRFQYAHAFAGGVHVSLDVLVGDLRVLGQLEQLFRRIHQFDHPSPVHGHGVVDRSLDAEEAKVLFIFSYSTCARGVLYPLETLNLDSGVAR